jgi:hypothetical protein
MGKAQGVPAAARPPPVAVLPLSISWRRYGDGVQRRDAMDLRRQLGATTTEMVSSSIGLCFPCSYGRVGVAVIGAGLRDQVIGGMLAWRCPTAVAAWHRGGAGIGVKT